MSNTSKAAEVWGVLNKGSDEKFAGNDSLLELMLQSIAKDLDENIVDRWIRPLKIVDINNRSMDATITFLVPNRFYMGMVADNYEDQIRRAFYDNLIEINSIYYVVQEELATLHLAPHTSMADQALLAQQNRTDNPTNQGDANNATTQGTATNTAATTQTETDSNAKMDANTLGGKPAGGGDAHDHHDHDHEGALRSTKDHDTGLSTNYTFESFVRGTSNQFPFSMCESVSEGNFHTYNPLVIYGGVGLGKTHLMHATGNAILEKFPKINLLCVDGEQFTREVVHASRTNTYDKLNEKYRNIDILLFDDIQFISGKGRTSETFFYLFNDLYESNKQIIITSDKEPKRLEGFEDRLKSRFSWGLSVQIEMPGVEELAAIITTRSRLKGVYIDDDTALFMAYNIKFENIREVVGTILKLHAYSSFKGRKIDVDFVKETMKDELTKGFAAGKPAADDIIKKVAAYYNVKITDIKGQSRKQSVSVPRQVSMYALRTILELSYAEIGTLFGKNHTTAMHSINKVEGMLEEDMALKLAVENIMKNYA